MTVVNLRRVRKQRARAGKEAQAAENRVRFGEAKSAKKQSKSEHDHAKKKLDQHKRET